MLSFRVKDADHEVMSKFFKAFKIFMLAESFGGLNSVGKPNGLMSYVPPEVEQSPHVTAGFVRLSVGA